MYQHIWHVTVSSSLVVELLHYDVLKKFMNFKINLNCKNETWHFGLTVCLYMSVFWQYYSMALYVMNFKRPIM